MHSATGLDCLYVRRLWACIVLFSGVLTTVLSRPIHNETTELLQAALDPGLHNSYGALKYPCIVYHGLTIERYDQNIDGAMQRSACMRRSYVPGPLRR